MDPLQWDNTKFNRMVCCGKGIHKWCYEEMIASSLSDEQKNSCSLCRTTYPTSDKEAVEQLRRWVEKGKAWAQVAMGQNYRHGLGVEQSYQRAKEMYELSALQGYTTAQYTLGIMYYCGQGVDQSYERAAEYYEAAATQGDADAQFNLGVLYATGQGVNRSFEKACALWRKAAEQGDVNAIMGLQKLDELSQLDEQFLPKPLECASCYRPHSDHKLSRCTGCHCVFYCGKKCQKEHWKEHKEMCKRFTAN
jgi:TPR repeat protein